MPNLPKPALVIIAALTGTSIIGILGMIDYKFALIAGIGIVVLAALLAGFYLFQGWWQKRRSVAMSGQMQQHSAGAPAGINDPAKRAQLDSLKRNFDTGLEKFRTSGKDVYKLPWYLIVGEPGGGKSEAVRHCNVGFPPGLQDELQGVGGTINMNWWFTNRAVLLDTAGRLMFEEVKPGETSEWREFLQLLKRNRPNCPINGLFLVIPTDSLIRDSAAEINRKAGKIAQQMDLIQRTLDVRFPVFILITKADLLVGFREFFETFEDPATQHQMLGWSNPEPRDEPFKPELVERHLQVVVDRIKKRRLGLLRDPVPHTGGGRRADEVDALYSLPQSFSLIAPRLRDYLQTIFVAGEWSAKPLFLRGIYFTSSMREGSALDQELANAIGVQLEDLPDGKAWERERAFFLRDLFIDKAFPEQGLVTRATNTKTLLKKRRMLVFGAIALASAAFLGFTIYGYRQFKSTIGDRARYWKPAAQDGWTKAVAPGPDTWTPIIRAETKGNYSYQGNLNAFGPQNVNLLDYHAKLRELSGQTMQVGFVFRPLAAAKKGFLAEQRDAQRVVYEASVVQPLLAAVRSQLLADVATSTADLDADEILARTTRLEDALATLIRLEAQGLAPVKSASEVSQQILFPALKYVSGKDLSTDKTAGDIFTDLTTWTYFQPAKNNPVWPPAWLLLGSAALKANPPIEQGLEHRFQFIQSEQAAAKKQIDSLVAIHLSLQDFRKKEAALNAKASAANRESTELDPGVSDALAELGASKKSLDAAVATYAENGSGDTLSLKASYEKILTLITQQSTGAFAKIEAAAQSAPKTEKLLFKEVLDRIAEKKQEMTSNLQSQLKAGALDPAVLDSLDKDLLQNFEPTGQRKYVSRFEAYDKAAKLGAANAEGGKDVIPALGSVGTRLTAARNNLAGQKSAGLFSAPVAADYWLDLASVRQPTQIVRGYVESVRSYFDGALTFPLVTGGGKGADQDTVLARARQVKNQVAALSAKELPKPCEDLKAKLQAFAEGFDQLKHHDVTPGRATVTLVKAPDNSRYVQGQNGLESSFGRVTIGTFGENEAINVRWGRESSLGEALSLGTPASFWGKTSRSANGFSFAVSFEERSPKPSELPKKSDIMAPLN